MPAGDGTGPNGMGPMTGRGAGFCAGYNAPGYMNRGFGRGFGGRGGGRGWRNWFRATGLTGWQRAAAGWPGWGGVWEEPPVGAAAAPSELDVLKAQAKHFEDALDGIRKRLDELEPQSGQD